ncbi:hypothetical protein CPC08DRAFT_643271, partial [Agrocybe pediades]
YHKWCKENNFISMLPEDTAARRQKEEDEKKALLQTQVSNHFDVAERRVEEPVEKVLPYTDTLFRQAAIKWLIQTNQPVACVDNPAFQDMIKIAARATKGVKIPGRMKARNAIIREFKAQMNSLSERLNVSVLALYHDLALYLCPTESHGERGC